jgi:hypothetical protein
MRQARRQGARTAAPLDMREIGQVLERDTPLHIEQGRHGKQAAINTAQLSKSSRARR